VEIQKNHQKWEALSAQAATVTTEASEDAFGLKDEKGRSGGDKAGNLDCVLCGAARLAPKAFLRHVAGCAPKKEKLLGDAPLPRNPRDNKLICGTVVRHGFCPRLRATCSEHNPVMKRVTKAKEGDKVVCGYPTSADGPSGRSAPCLAPRGSCPLHLGWHVSTVASWTQEILRIEQAIDDLQRERKDMNNAVIKRNLTTTSS
jgi:hypothetical protein